jgi:hypothetical protein
VVRAPDQLQVGGKAAAVQVVVARMADRGRHEAGAGERAQRIVVVEMIAAGAVGMHDEREGSGGRCGSARGGHGIGADLGRAAPVARGIEDDGRHLSAFHGIGELQVLEAGAEVVSPGCVARFAGEKREGECQSRQCVAHGRDPRACGRAL